MLNQWKYFDWTYCWNVAFLQSDCPKAPKQVIHPKLTTVVTSWRMASDQMLRIAMDFVFWIWTFSCFCTDLLFFWLISLFWMDVMFWTDFLLTIYFGVPSHQRKLWTLSVRRGAAKPNSTAFGGVFLISQQIFLDEQARKSRRCNKNLQSETIKNDRRNSGVTLRQKETKNALKT